MTNYPKNQHEILTINSRHFDNEGQRWHLQCGSEVAVQQLANSPEWVVYSESTETSPCAWANPSDCPAGATSLAPSPSSPSPSCSSARRGSWPRPSETGWSSARSEVCCVHLGGLGSGCRHTVARSVPVTAACWSAHLQTAANTNTSALNKFYEYLQVEAGHQGSWLACNVPGINVLMSHLIRWMQASQWWIENSAEAELECRVVCRNQ